MSRKGFIVLVWILIILVGPITLFINTDLNLTFSNSLLVINLFQRLTGMLAFSFLFVQILLGSYMNFWTKFLGALTFKYHVVEGIVGYGMFLAHPLLYVVFTYVALQKLTTFILPDLSINTANYELFLTYGRIGFILLSIGVAAALLRNNPRLRHSWRKFHILNYFSFFFVAVHAFNVGTDMNLAPFNFFFWIALLIISGVVFHRFIYPKIKPILSPSPNGQL